MILYVDETEDSKKAITILSRELGNIPLAPSEGAGLPEFVIGGVSYVGLRAIERWLKEPREPVEE